MPYEFGLGVDLRSGMGQAPREPLSVGTFREHVAAYRGQLGDPGFAGGLLAESGTTSDLGDQLARLHSLAAERFEEQAVGLAERAEWVDAYERGAYGEPPVNGVMLTVLMTTTLGFSTVVLLRMRLVGAILLAVSLGLNAVFVWMWRRPSYRYEAEYRKPWDAAANLARERADQARRASLVVGGHVQVLSPPRAIDRREGLSSLGRGSPVAQGPLPGLVRCPDYERLKKAGPTGRIAP
jgi:hypothetical protein